MYYYTSVGLVVAYVAVQTVHSVSFCQIKSGFIVTRAKSSFNHKTKKVERSSLDIKIINNSKKPSKNRTEISKN